MFRLMGNYQHNLDDKGRLMIPSLFREALEGGAVLTQGFDKCLMVMTEAYFKEVYNRIDAMNLTDPTARLLRRMIVGNAFPVEVDKIGRILVPQKLRTFLGIQSGELVVVGQGEYIELWAPDLWNEQEKLLQDAEANNARFSTLDLSKTS